MESTEAVLSYQEELQRKNPKRVDKRYRGGAYGCPGDYFRGAAAMDCRKDFEERCARCWSESYKDEEWIGNEK